MFHGETLHPFVCMDVYTLSAKPRWAYAVCSMYSSRSFSVKRHINNLHDSTGNIDGIAGRR